MTDPESRETSKLKAFAQLLRLPNVFTAMADVMMGFMATSAKEELTPLAWLLVAASSCLYLAGMVLNDVFDYSVDQVERPKRPLPSGRISLRVAKALGFALLIAGVVLGCVASGVERKWTGGMVAMLLAAAVVLYDRVLKRTPLGPISMGSCRFLNVLLGMSGGTVAWTKAHWLVAIGIGVYIAGVTWFARTEARRSNRRPLVMATVVIAAGLVILTLLPVWARPETIQIGDAEVEILSGDADSNHPAFGFATQQGWKWYALWVLLGLSIGNRAIWAIVHPVPVRVQTAIKHFIMSLVILDAAMAFASHGIPAAISILLLLAPTILIGHWIYST